nr:unnamed protein product [Callosobruchus analis]
MNKSSRGYKLLTKCKNLEDSNGPKRAAGSNEKATHGYEYWEQKKVNRWFCNQPLSPVQNDDPPQVHVLQNITVVPGHSKQDGGNESSSAPEGSISDFNVYTPEEVKSCKSDEPSDLHISCYSEQRVAKKPLLFFDAYTDLHIIDISNKNDAKHEESMEVATDVGHHSDEALAAPKGTNSNTEHEKSCRKHSTNKLSTKLLNKQNMLLRNTAADSDVPKCTNGRDDTEHVQSGGEISTNKINVKKLKNFCYYCETDVTNFARHITNNHSHEIEVIKLNSLPLKSVERKRLLAELRNKGII